MKVSVHFKTPDALHELPRLAREEAEREYEHLTDKPPGDKEEWLQSRALHLDDEIRGEVERFVRYRETVTLEFCSDGTPPLVIPIKKGNSPRIDSELVIAKEHIDFFINTEHLICEEAKKLGDLDLSLAPEVLVAKMVEELLHLRGKVTKLGLEGVMALKDPA